MSSGTPAGDPAPEPPKSLLQKVGPAFAIGMTALAAVFGSMSAAQLQQSMYYKSQAAQDQSKSANQWGFFGFKRSRALAQEIGAAESRSLSGYLRYTFPETAAATDLDKEAVKWLNGQGPPQVKMPPTNNPDLDQLVTGIRNRKQEAELLALASKIPEGDITHAIDEAENFAAKTADEDWDKVVKAAKALAKKVIDAADRKPGDKVDVVKKEEADAVQRLVGAMEDRRYRGEGAMNLSVGLLYDARVKWSSAKSDFHKHRSLLLGYAMLVAQIGAVAASLALARRGGILWLFVALIGITAVGFGGVAFLAPGMLPF